MTKKDYELIADALASVMIDSEGKDSETIGSIVSKLADKLGENNPDFNAEKFIARCWCEGV